MFLTSGSIIGPGQQSFKWSHKPYTTRLQLVTPQNVTPSVFTDISWDTIQNDDVGAFTIANPKFITVPTGFNIVRVSFNSCWQSTGSGTGAFRLSRLCLNGNALNGAGLLESSSMQPTSQTSCSGWFSVNCADQIKMVAWQNRTTAPTTITWSQVANGGPAWIEAEWGRV